MTKKDRELAVAQMFVIQTVLHGGGMNVQQAVRNLCLDNEECLELAKNEGLTWLANEMQPFIKK